MSAATPMNPEDEDIDISDSIRLRVYREEVRGNISAFASAIASMWRAIAVLLLIGLLSVAGALWNRQEILNSRQGNYKGRMLVCLGVLVDNDRDFALPTQCNSPMIMQYYPKSVCKNDDILDPNNICGSKSDEI